MAIPKKGSRKIIVNSIEYRWRIRSKPTYFQLFDGKLILAVEKISENNTSDLIVESTYNRPDTISDSLAIITPKDVEKVIRYALELGWKPDGETKPYYLKMTVGQPIIRDDS